MSHLRITTHVDAPIDRVFDLATEFKRYPEWNVAYIEAGEPTGPIQVGTRVHATMRLLGRTMSGWGEILEVERPRLLKIAGTAQEGGKVTTTYRLTPGATGTEAELEVEYELPAGILGQIADKLFIEKAVERDLQHSMENFKALVALPVPALA